MDPEQVASAGMDPAAVRRALALVERRGAVAQLCVVRRGVTVVDAAFGCDPRALFWVFSATKPYPAIVVHLLAARGLIDLDRPIAEYWPGFERHGKDGVTARHVLRHRSGMAAPGGSVAELAAMTDWRRSVRLAAESRLRSEPGAVPSYLFLGYGFVLGELVRRATGHSLPEVLASEILEPLGLADSHLGLPHSEWARHVPVRGGALGAAVGTVLNRRSTRAAVIPAAGLSTTARDLAAFYVALLRGSVVGADVVARAVRPSSEGEVDRRIMLPIRWSEGFQLGGPRSRTGPMGVRTSVRTFGHNGSNCCIAWADPERDLVVAHLTNRVEAPRVAVAQLAAVADTLVDACDRLRP